MNELGLKAVIRRKRSKHSTYRGQVGKIADHVLNRDFKTDKPNHKWATDVTEFKVVDEEGNTKKLYLSPIMDLFHGEIISYSIKDRPTYELVQEMLDKAITQLKDAEAKTGTSIDKLILHSDQGWHYQMNNYQQILKDNGIIQSISDAATVLIMQ